MYQTLEPVPAAVPTQSFLARSKYDAAPGASGAVVTVVTAVTAVTAVAERAAVAAGTATVRRPGRPRSRSR